MTTVTSAETERETYTRRRPTAWTILRLVTTVFWIGVASVVLFELWAPSRVAADRARLLNQFQSSRQSRAIAMIHRQEAFSPFGVPVTSYIDIEDSESILRAIRETPDDQPIDLILHTPGGLVLAAEQIAHALVARQGKVTVFVPHYAMSGGTLIALAADEVVMDPNAVLGPVDPQINDLPAASIVKLVTLKPIAQVSDEMLVLADVAQKARIEVVSFVADVLLKHLPRDRAVALATTLTEGRWTHDFPITVEAARTLGFPVSTDVPPVLYELMSLYPQADQGRPTVLSVPLGHPSSPGSSTPSADDRVRSRARTRW
jgi:ClpP class serine protease